VQSKIRVWTTFKKNKSIVIIIQQMLQINIQNPSRFQSKIEMLQIQFPLILNKVVQYTILEKINPGISQYKSLLQGSISELHSKTTQLKQTSLIINEYISSIADNLESLNVKIVSETKREKNMALKLSKIIPENNGSQILVDDYTTLYSEQYTKNALTTIMIIASIVKIGTMLKS